MKSRPLRIFSRMILMKEMAFLGPPTINFSGEKISEIASDLAYMRTAMVNVVFSGISSSSSDRQWALIDTGIPGLTGKIEQAARQRFGTRSRPGAIILTHAHFDHVGGLKHLAQKWNVSIYAHPLEIPYLDGRASYSPPDPRLSGGLMPLLAPLLPKNRIDVGLWLQPLPVDGSVPAMPGWRWIHTPGHSAGHISLWREFDRTLIVGDAFLTTNQKSAYSTTCVQKAELSGPPMYFTPDWHAARNSIAILANLRPELVITGHGKAMKGAEMLKELKFLAIELTKTTTPCENFCIDKAA